MAALIEIWSRLRSVRGLKFTARSRVGTGWTGEGTGTVAVSEPADGIIIFTEAGTWQSIERKVFTFNNVYRWSTTDTALRLEHLRFGPDRPVFLFDLVPGENGTWKERTPHICSEDRYAGTLAVESDHLLVAWSVTGPDKQESIRYTYWPA